MTAAVGFEPTMAEPNGTEAHLLNHSDILPIYQCIILFTIKLNNIKKLIS